ncbi:MMPL family transporter [Halodesulfurarchaeum sp. HSR-GB]|uniref:efflux RND transporter permease subunit n=1 Tax=Halodesulfurarchaeum sp. HSR-GB TaxID=3074077 RepID=UPI0028671DED|nr:MMPL family transporter [Halodesulfurarchaeum sp. HSR-GB]MDR5657095.1 MMPL family transporter [Halodesulfurarchaeum sp. HSR-GB]
MVDHDAIVEQIAAVVSQRSRTVILVFLVITLLMSAGLGNVSTETGTSQFSEGTDAEAALQDVNREFGPAFAADEGTTQLIQVSENALSKPALLTMLRTQQRLEDRTELRITATRSAASTIATTLDPSARSVEDQIRAVERATPKQIDAAVREATAQPGLTGILSTDFNRESATAGATIAVITHEVPAGLASGAGTSGDSPLQSIQLETQRVVEAGGGDIRVFGTGIISAEFASVIFDSLILVIPAAILLIVTFLIYAYRDPLDLAVGLLALVMTIVWTFGFMGLAGIPFTQMLTAVPPLLLAVGIDFGIHSVNRYREERVTGVGIAESMDVMTRQLIVAFFIVTGSTVIGFAANLTSSLPPLRDFGLIAAIGIIFTFLIFGIFLPALKLEVDRYRERTGFPTFASAPIGREGSVLGSALDVGVVIARRGPRIFLAVLLVSGLAAGAYGTGIDTSFSEEDFLPPEEVPDYLASLPEPFAPETYTVTRDLNFLEAEFESAARDSVTVYVSDSMRRDTALQSIEHVNRDPPDAILQDGRQAAATSIIDVIDDYRAADPQFDALVERNDRNDDGVPDDDLTTIYDELFASPYAAEASQYLTEDYRSARIVYDTEAESSQKEISADAKTLADQYRLSATATGQIVVFQAVSDTILDSAVRSLAVALGFTAIFLLFIYRVLEGSATLGIVNLVPIVLTVSFIIGTMRALGIPFNAMTATVLSIAIGLGIDYSAHMTHRFADEYDGTNLHEALDETVFGTGGALTGSMLTTATGIGVLVIAVTPILGQFGFVTGIAIVYSYLTSVLVLPSVVVVWESAGGLSLP